MSFGAVPQTIAAPAGSIESLARITTLLDRAEPAVRRRYLQLTVAAKQVGTLEQIADLLEAGQIDQALVLTEGIAEGTANALEGAYLAAGISSSAAIANDVDRLFDFNATNSRSVGYLQANRLRLVREFSQQQRAATMEIMQDAFARGLAPIEQARAFRGSIGLTSTQAQAVTNYRRLLTEGTPASIGQALDRKLRDRRFDPSLRAAAAGTRTLTADQIDKMVLRYEQRFVAFRANTIARTETVASVGQGDWEAFQQAIDSEIVQPEDVISTWKTARDERVRGSHRAMNNQEQPFGEPFVSGDGNSLRFPGDPLGPASDTINCRCVVGRKIDQPNRARLPAPLAQAAG